MRREKIPAKCQNCIYMRAWSIRMDGNHEYDCRKKPRSMVGNPDCEWFEKRELEDKG